MSESNTIYDDAELTALQVVREAVAESYDGEGHTAKVLEIIKPYVEKHRTADGDATAVVGLVVALGRLAETTWSVVLHNQLGHYPTEQEFAARLDSFELHKLEQHQDPEDPIRACEGEPEDEDPSAGMGPGEWMGYREFGDGDDEDPDPTS
jgi:hypothetical protein